MPFTQTYSDQTQTNYGLKIQPFSILVHILILLEEFNMSVSQNLQLSQRLHLRRRPAPPRARQRWDCQGAPFGLFIFNANLPRFPVAQSLG